MRKFVELNEKELLNVEGGDAIVQGSAYSYTDCKTATASFTFGASGSESAGVTFTSGSLVSQGLNIAGTTASMGATSYQKVSCKPRFHCK